MKTRAMLVLFIGLLTTVALPLRADSPTAAAPDVGAAVSLAEVPSEVMETATSAAPGVFFKAASWLLNNDTREYRISGTLFRQEVDVYVADGGKLIRVDKNNLDD